MALFIIERDFAEQIDVTSEMIQEIETYNADASLKWLFTFLSAERRKSYCLYEADNPEALRRQAEDLGFPADVIVEVSEINPAAFAAGS